MTRRMMGVWLRGALRVRRGEGGVVALSGLFFFLLMLGYFLIRPVREAMGVQRSMEELRWLFVTTCGVSLVVTLAFGSAVSRLDRSRFIPLAVRAVSACLVVFAGLLVALDGAAGVRVGFVFYVWLSIVNLFMVSVFWAFMADVWTLEQGKRLFPSIAVGGTVGALLGGLVAWRAAGAMGPAWLMLTAAGLFEIAVRVMRAIDARAGRATARERGGVVPGGVSGGGRIGGWWWDGAAAMVRSPYLLGIGCYIVLMAVSSTLLYFTQARLVVDASSELSERVALFGQLDMWTQAATLLAQLFVTGRLIRLVGVGWTLAVLPLVTAAGFAALAWVSRIEGVEPWKVFAVFAAFNAVHRATRYAVARPARETLFGVLPVSEKYKAKPIVDVFVYRGGDVAGVGVDRWLAGAAVGLGGVALAAAPLAVVWCGLSLALAWGQRRRAEGGGSGTLVVDMHGVLGAPNAGLAPGGVER